MVAGYSPVEDHISNLASVYAPSHALMTFGLGAFGVGVATAAWPLRRFIGNPAAIALGFNGLFVVGVMLTPEGRSSDTDFLHGGFAILVYWSLTLVAPLAALTFRRRGLIYWAMASWVAGVGTGVFLWISLESTKSGLFQRLGLTTTDVWLMAIGFAVVTGHFDSFLPPVSGASVGMLL